MRYLLLLLTVFLLFGCAQFVPPTGGKKDIAPPQLLSSFPENKSLNFKGKEINLTFDEIIDATNLRQELIITPEPKSVYELKQKAYGINLKFKESFADSTTYTFNFRNGIKDLNEKNPAKNLKLIFSTGNEIDSLSIQGTLYDLFTNLPKDNALVGLYNIHTTDTLSILKRKPDYFTKTDTAGQYLFENIKAGWYRLLSFSDNNSNLIFDKAKEQFAFLPDTIRLDSNIQNIDLNLYTNNDNPIKIKSAVSRVSNFLVTLDRTPLNVKVDFPIINDSITFKVNGAEIAFFNHPIIKDTILTKIIVEDSLHNKSTYEQKVYFFSDNNKNKKQTSFRIKSNTPTNQEISYNHEYQLQFETPITKFDQNKLSITADSSYQLKYTTTWKDQSHTQLNIAINDKKAKRIILHLPAGSITNYTSDTNQTYTLINKVYPQDYYGIIRGKTTNDTTNKIVQLLNADNFKVIDYQITKHQFIFKEILPGNYLLRLIYDRNNDEQWNPGNFETNVLPEQIKVFKELIRLKSNFEITDLNLN